MKLKSLVFKCRNSFDKIVIYDKKWRNLFFEGKEEEVEDCVLEREVKEWKTNNHCLFIVVKKEIKAEVKEEVKSKVDNDTLIYFLGQHLDLDEDKTVIHYVNIEGRTVEIKLSDLQWNWEKVDLLLHFKIIHRINNENGDLVLYLEQFRER